MTILYPLVTITSSTNQFSSQRVVLCASISDTKNVVGNMSACEAHKIRNSAVQALCFLRHLSAPMRVDDCLAWSITQSKEMLSQEMHA